VASVEIFEVVLTGVIGGDTEEGSKGSPGGTTLVPVADPVFVFLQEIPDNRQLPRTNAAREVMGFARIVIPPRRSARGGSPLWQPYHGPGIALEENRKECSEHRECAPKNKENKQNE